VTLARYSWVYIAYLVGVILFGAWVRITGSGAGCGDHWPLCNGEVIPRDLPTTRIIELTHRVTSGISGLFGIYLLFKAWKSSARGWAIASFVFLLLEGFIGAVLVKKELVAGDASVSRAIVISLHLLNTLALVFCTVAVAVKASPVARVSGVWSRPVWILGLFAVVLTSMSGAITALGDTLFPTQPAFGPELIAKIREDLNATQHFLVRLRLIHPVVAAASAAMLLALLAKLQRATKDKWALTGLALCAAQVLLGLLNIQLGAPGWMQIAHLAMAQALWIVLSRLLFTLA
jgi:heme A synthase